jgi:hypothetical protein
MFVGENDFDPKARNQRRTLKISKSHWIAMTMNFEKSNNSKEKV